MIKYIKNKNTKKVIIIPLSIIVIIILWFVFKPKDLTSGLIMTEVKKGNFTIQITTTGELSAKNSEDILGPNVRDLGGVRLKIAHIVPNGTLVQPGDYVATLEKTELFNKSNETKEEIKKLETQYATTKLDTAQVLRGARNELLNKKLELEEIKLELEQSQFETPATIRQIEIKLDRSQRAYEQLISSYDLKVEKEKAKIQEVYEKLKDSRKKLSDINSMISQFTITAPKAGMVIHPSGWELQGTNIIGRNINTLNPVIASLPNMEKLISKTYVNEIDISKIEEGQTAEMTVDAFPDKKYYGKVISVANMRNQYMLSQAKLFEVIIELDNKKNILKPSMTSKNKIIVSTYKDVLYVPIECLHHDNGYSYVFTDSYKKQVVVGEANDNEIIIRKGLKEGEKVCLSKPADPDSFRLIKLEETI